MKKESTPESGRVKNKLQQNSVNEVWIGKWMLTGLEAAGGPDSGDNRQHAVVLHKFFDENKMTSLFFHWLWIQDVFGNPFWIFLWAMVVDAYPNRLSSQHLFNLSLTLKSMPPV